MDSDTASTPGGDRGAPRSGVLVGRSVAVRDSQPEPAYFTERHRRFIGRTGRVHAIVPSAPRENPLVKVGFAEGTQIVFFRLNDLDVHEASTPEGPRKHGKRGSHLPKRT